MAAILTSQTKDCGSPEFRGLKTGMTAAEFKERDVDRADPPRQTERNTGVFARLWWQIRNGANRIETTLRSVSSSAWPSTYS